MSHRWCLRPPETDFQGRLVTLLRAHFGLLTEEACKGGRPREIQIGTLEQQRLVDRVGWFQREHSERLMIPNRQKFVTCYRNYNKAREAVGIPGHGLRHAWAQWHFEGLVGMPAPHAGGSVWSSLDAAGRVRWDRAAAIVNQELGHGCE